MGPILATLAAFVLLCVVIARIWQQEARRPVDEFKGENGDGL